MNSTTNATNPINGLMGTSISRRRGVLLIENGGDESTSRSKKPLSLEECLSRISNHKAKSSTREEALFRVVKALTMDVKLVFLKNNFATLLYHCLFCIKKGKGSVKEFILALQVIGLLVMVVEDESKAHEIYRDSVDVLSLLLESVPKKSSSSNNNHNDVVLDCLGVVAFFGNHNTYETQQVMKLIWEFLEKEYSSNTEAAAAAIFAWSFLLSALEVWNINHRDWQGAISLLLNVLDGKDSGQSVYVATAEALALIFEINCLEKFSTEDKDTAQDLKDIIIEKLRCQAMKVSMEEEGAEQKVRIDVLEYFESGKFLKTCVKIAEDKIILSTWCQKIQLNFMKRFLGDKGFVNLMRKNKILQEIFEFMPKQNDTSQLLVTPEEEITLRFFQPKAQIENDGSLLPSVTRKSKHLQSKIDGRSPNSYLRKARTRLLNKKRLISHEEKHQLLRDD